MICSLSFRRIPDSSRPVEWEISGSPITLRVVWNGARIIRAFPNETLDVRLMRGTYHEL